MPKHHQFDGRDSDNYRQPPKHVRVVLLHATIEHTEASNLASCCPLQVLVRSHQLPHSRNRHDVVDLQVKIGQQAYQVQALQADVHLSQHSHLLAGQACGHALSIILDCLDPNAIVLPTNEVEERRLPLGLQPSPTPSVRCRYLARIGAQLQKHLLPTEGSASARH